MEAYKIVTQYNHNLTTWFNSLPIQKGEQIEIIVISSKDIERKYSYDEKDIAELGTIQLNTNENKKKVPEFGCAKGMFVMSEDFNEPLEDFKEYM